MNERPILFSTAKFAKEVGFAEAERYYDKDGKIEPIIGLVSNAYPAARQSELQSWFRKTHKIYVQVTADFYMDGINHNWQVLVYDKDDITACSPLSTGMYGDNGEYPEYEDALEDGLIRAIEIVRKIV